MALRKTGSRLLSVGCQTYRWRVRRTPSHSQGAYATASTFVVQQEGGGAILVVRCNGPRRDNWLGLPGVIVTPALVAASIRRAIAAGWTPAEAGPPFHLRQVGG
jgi:hypothetical protein